jgi:hypothetical protein
VLSQQYPTRFLEKISLNTVVSLGETSVPVDNLISKKPKPRQKDVAYTSAVVRENATPTKATTPPPLVHDVDESVFPDFTRKESGLNSEIFNDENIKGRKKHAAQKHHSTNHRFTYLLSYELGFVLKNKFPV